jgi:hypothetical protein
MNSPLSQGVIPGKAGTHASDAFAGKSLLLFGLVGPGLRRDDAS